ncbi:MAG: hypothetical protein N2255_01585, partial [Kiritimatiellae bacterium]|nr:hypothetical protein [Kiritimatiellia bacterium]
KDKVNFWYAENAVGEPKPTDSGTKQSWTLRGLSSGTEVFFAMKVHDEEGNRSEISNCVKVRVP